MKTQTAWILGLLSTGLLLTIASPVLGDGQNQEIRADHDAFQKLLDQVDGQSLHAALHDFSPKKFQHGMFPEDRTALEAIHKEEPGVASGIVKMAKLAKRQDNGTVSTPTPPPSEPSPTPSPPSPVGISETPSQPSPPPESTPSPSPSTAGEEPTTSIPSPSTTAPPSSSLTFGEVITTTNDQGQTIISTVGGGVRTLGESSSSSKNAKERSSLTSTFLQTSTLANGDQSTVTAVTVVGGGSEGNAASSTVGVGAGGTAGAQPGLQTGEAAMTRGCGKEMAVMLGAAMGVAYML